MGPRHPQMVSLLAGLTYSTTTATVEDAVPDGSIAM